ncbi:putative lipid II flippase FtsW [Tessaracoccus antarcticus]|uniref:Probable peptidoglycan glycosyltransferase FtsW n=1 Tax=Tessaracoccus antarcticus TaxID=2479848 RepID=A0A3M0G4C4_9ACTN|nr:putative lipid II flippase FtsW [Tessaracoccus antarcticus]RMB59694.1 putative lipid II flippase FtsW [Tessaracoccus antarcticus]
MAIATDTAAPPRPTEAPTGIRALAASPMADFYLVTFAVTILCAIGGMMVLSASSVLAQADGRSPYYYATRQMIFMVVGVVAAVAISRINPRVLQRLGWAGWGIAMGGLLLVLSPLGHSVNGNQNWINIGGFTFQPSEFAKLGLIIWAAAIWHTKRGRLHEVPQLLIPFVPGAGILLALILAGKDLGTGIVVGIVIIALLFFIGTSLRVLVPSMILGVTAMLLLVIGSGNRMARVNVFLDPQSNTDLSSQPMAAVYALASGGWWGLGLGASKQKWGGLKDAAHTDFIFAVIGEELGLFGVLVVIAMFALLARAGFSIALRSDKIFNRIVASGITAWLLVQGLINIMVVMHLLPVLGIPLPFVSSGGSALLANLLAVGVLLACARDTPDARRHLASRKRVARPRMTSILAAGRAR